MQCLTMKRELVDVVMLEEAITKEGTNLVVKDSMQRVNVR